MNIHNQLVSDENFLYINNTRTSIQTLEWTSYDNLIICANPNLILQSWFLRQFNNIFIKRLKLLIIFVDRIKILKSVFYIYVRKFT